MLVFFIFLCAVFSVILVYPLPYFATQYQSVFSYTVTGLLVFLILFTLAKKIKKHKFYETAVFLIKFFVSILSFFSVIFLILKGKRLLIPLPIALSVVFFIFFSKISSKHKAELATENS